MAFWEILLVFGFMIFLGLIELKKVEMKERKRFARRIKMRKGF